MGTAAAGALLLPMSPRGFLGASRTVAPGTNQPDHSTAGVSFQNHRRLCLEDGHAVHWAPGDAHGSGGPLTPGSLGKRTRVRDPLPHPRLAGSPDGRCQGDRGPHPGGPSSESSQGSPGTVHMQDKGLWVNPDSAGTSGSSPRSPGQVSQERGEKTRGAALGRSGRGAPTCGCREGAGAQPREHSASLQPRGAGVCLHA